MQVRYVDRGRPYDHEAWRSLQKETKSVGVFSGFTLAPSSTVGTQVTAAAGSLMLPSGVVVVETEAVTVEIGSGFPPAAATDYTIATRHEEANVGLISGEAMAYYATASLLTEQPSDGVILGWIRHPGASASLTEAMITNAPHNSPFEIAQDFANRLPFRLLPPDFVVPTYETDTSLAVGYESDKVWRGISHASSGSGTPVVSAYITFPVYAEPWQVNVESIIPTGTTLGVTIFDTARATVSTTVFSPHTTFSVDTISITQGANTWTAGGTGVLKLDFTLVPGATIKVSDLEVDFWPYALSRT